MSRLRKEAQMSGGFASLEISEQLLSDWSSFLRDIDQDGDKDGGKWRPVMAGMSVDL